MAKKQMWGASPMWAVGIAMIFASGFLIRGGEHWIILVLGGVILAIDGGLLRPAEGKRNFLEVILSGAVAITVGAASSNPWANRSRPITSFSYWPWWGRSC